MMWLPERFGFKPSPSPEEFSTYLSLVENLGRLAIVGASPDSDCEMVREASEETSNAIFLMRKIRDV